VGRSQLRIIGFLVGALVCPHCFRYAIQQEPICRLRVNPEAGGGLPPIRAGCPTCPLQGGPKALLVVACSSCRIRPGTKAGPPSLRSQSLVCPSTGHGLKTLLARGSSSVIGAAILQRSHTLRRTHTRTEICGHEFPARRIIMFYFSLVGGRVAQKLNTAWPTSFLLPEAEPESLMADAPETEPESSVTDARFLEKLCRMCIGHQGFVLSFECILVIVCVRIRWQRSL
jgi:hypothetical protein